MAPQIDSLVIADRFELIGAISGVQSDIPELMNAAGVGARFQLLAPDSETAAVGASQVWDLGAPQPTQDIVQSLLLDGERPFGARASNRTILLPIKITAPDWVTLTAARELLMQAVDAQTFTMTWTQASTGLAMVFDCFRALPATYSYGFLPGQPFPICILTLNFQALPYGRSEPSTLQQTSFLSPILGGVAAPPSPAVVDSFTSVVGTNWAQSSTQFVVGPKSARYTPPTGQVYPWNTVTYTKSGLSVNLIPNGSSAPGLSVLSVWTGQSFDTGNWAAWAAFKSNVTMRWTLTDNAAHKLSFSRTVNAVPWSATASTPKWTRISVPIPMKSATFNYADVTAYTVTVSNWAGGGKTSWVRMNLWLDAITANPGSLANPASARGVVYNIMGTAGTARTPISCQFQLPQTGTVSAELTGTGQWWPPLGVTSVQAECVGAGGSGGARTTSGLGGGGGGGEYAAEPTLTVAAGTPVPYSCGTGGQSGAVQQVTTFAQQGTGSWVCPAGVTTIKAECWGAGGQGAAGGGGGGGGEYAAEGTLTVVPGVAYPFVVAGGGYNTQYGFGNAGNGGITTFGSLTNTALQGKVSGTPTIVTAHGGLMAKSGGTVAGGSGGVSTNTVHFSGGAGGTSPGYGGGGGGSSGYSGGAGVTGSNGSGNAGGAGGSGPGGDGGAGSSSPGFPVQGVIPGGGGGGGYGATTASAAAAGNNAGAAGADGTITLTYTVAAGSPVNGGATTFGSTVSTGGVIVTAHGGGSGALNSTANGTGAGGSGNTVAHTGGNGGTGGTNGGGGGGSGGSAAVGTNGTAGASGGTGAAGVVGGGKGANGATTANTPGDGAAPPGGGGGGADSTGTSVAGGSGGNGNIVVTWTPPIAPFSTLIAHRPGPASPPELNPCVPIQNTADAPTGIQYAVPSLVPGVNALFNGTYTVVLVNYNWDSPTASRSITVTVNQYEYGGTPGNQQSLNYPLSVTRAVTPATDITNGIVIMGELTLPVKLIDPSNTSAYFTVSITDTDVNDQFLDVLFLDTQGSTVLVNIPGNQYVNMMIDEPTPDRDLGLVLGSDLDRSQAISIMDSCIISGSPFYISPGDNLFLAYTVNGSPNLGVSYLNRWYLERLS
jgi:hypothetical protein